MRSSDVLKHLSNALFLMSLVVLVFAIVNGSSALYIVAGVLLVDSVVMTSLKRRMSRQAKAAAEQQPKPWAAS